jgi:phosphotransferase system enzyme I (PtsI)
VPTFGRSGGRRKPPLKGAPLSPGIALGTAVVLGRAGLLAMAGEGSAIGAPEVDGEIRRFLTACDRSVAELDVLRAAVGSRLDAAAAGIFEAQRLLVRDPVFVELVTRRIRERHVAAQAAVAAVAGELGDAMAALADPYLRERGTDFRDLGHRLQLALRDGEPELHFPAGSILVIGDLSPSLSVALDPATVRGVVTELGAKSSHAAILLRSSAIPAVGAIANAVDSIAPGSRLLLDAVAGLVFVEPDESVIAEYQRLESDLEARAAMLEGEVELPAVTTDGVAIRLAANLGKAADTEAALRWHADGVGLYRTEFAFDIRDGFPSEDEQAAILSGVAQRMHPRPIVFRLLDLGADKTLPYFPLPMVANPALGLRGTRLLLAHPEVLRPQLRAMLRVSAAYGVSVLLPMIGGVEEARAVRREISATMDQLRSQGVPFDPNLRLGAMIEVPSAALVAADLARELDFLSLGTNDLVQYLLAADRDEPAMNDYYRMLHPAVLRLIHDVCRAAGRAGKELTICGEMAGDPFYTELLLGLGLRSFSVAPRQLGALRHEIRRSSTRAGTPLARRLIRLSTRDEIRRVLDRRRARSDGAQPRHGSPGGSAASSVETPARLPGG